MAKRGLTLHYTTPGHCSIQLLFLSEQASVYQLLPFYWLLTHWQPVVSETLQPAPSDLTHSESTVAVSSMERVRVHAATLWHFQTQPEWVWAMTDCLLVKTIWSAHSCFLTQWRWHQPTSLQTPPVQLWGDSEKVNWKLTHTWQESQCFKHRASWSVLKNTEITSLDSAGELE